MNEKRRLVVNTLASGAAQFAALASAFIFMPLLIRAFGLSDYGIYLLAGSVSSYAALLDLGVGTSLTKMVAERTASDDHSSIATLVSSALAFYSIVGVAVALILVLMGVYAGSLFHLTADGAQLLRNLLFAQAVFQLWMWPAATANYVLAGFQRYTLMARISVCAIPLNIGAILIVLLTHQGPMALVLIGGVFGILVTSVSVHFARQQIRGHRVSPLLVRKPALKAIFLFSWSIFIIQIATVIVYQQTDRLILGVFVGAAAISLYEAAGKFQSLIAQLTAFATSAVMPYASQLDAQGRDETLQRLFIRGSKYTAALIAPVVVTLIVFARPLITRWLGPGFATQALAAQVLILPQLVMPLGPVGDSIITAQGKLVRRLPYTIGLTIANLVLSLLLVQKFGILGVVIGTSVPYLLDFPLHVRFLLKETGVSWRTWVREVIVPVYPALLAPLAVSVIALQTPLMSRLLGIATAMACAVGSYWVATFSFALTAPERDELRSVYRALKQKYLGPAPE